MDLALGRRRRRSRFTYRGFWSSRYNTPDDSPDPPFSRAGDEANASYDAGLRLPQYPPEFGRRPILVRRIRTVPHLTSDFTAWFECTQPLSDATSMFKSQLKSFWESADRRVSVLASLINGVPPSFINQTDVMKWLIRVCQAVICGPSGPKEATVSKKLFEMKSKVEAIHNSLQSPQDMSGCEDVIKFIEEELRCLEAEYRWKLYVQALIAWIAELIVGNGDCDSLQTLSVSLLAAQTIEIVLVASGDVERNPGPTYLDGRF